MVDFNINKKFSEKHIDEFSSAVFKEIKFNKRKKINFDLSNVEWISNQNLLFLTSLWKYLIEIEIDFKVKLFKDNFNEINHREAKNIIQLWEIWKVYQILPANEDLKTYFNITSNSSINILIEKFDVVVDDTFFERYGITPFISLNKIENFNDFKLLKQEIEPIYLLNNAIKDKVKENNCEHPFLHNTLSAIITRELYENFLDHFNKDLFDTDNNWAFLSLSLKKKLINYDSERLESNFYEEEIPETINFFKDNKGNFKNDPLIQFSFIDFGTSIIETIRDEYLRDNNLTDSIYHKPNDILRYAFKHNSSRHPISHKFSNIEKIIPRGLFDILSIVKRYKGLIIIRSGGGKIFYDFSHTDKSIDESCNEFGSEEDNFYGNFITIYIPPLIEHKNFNYTSIKPHYKINKAVKTKESYLSLFELLDKITLNNFTKSELYTKGLEELDIQLKRKNSNFIFFDFQGWEFDRRLTKIFIFYLTTTYDINIEKSITIINPPDREFLININIELSDLLENLVSFQTHPVPFIYFNSLNEDLSIYWTGVFNKTDNEVLDGILLEIPDLRKDDFVQPENVTGNIIFLDKMGNIQTNMPNQERFIKFYKQAYFKLENDSIETTMENAINYGDNNCIYICSGNYYTEKYITIDEIILNNFRNNNFSRLLFNRVRRVVDDIDDYIFISVTSMNNKILRSMISQNLIDQEKSIFLENYHYKLKDFKDQKPLKSNSKYILVCELIATGSLTNKIYNELKTDYNSSLEYVAVYINTLGDGEMDLIVDELKDKIIYLKRDEINKHHIKKLSELEIKKDIVRINPFTNQPILKSLEKTNISESIILNIDDFFEGIGEDKFKIKYLDFYGSIQSYFFDLKSILIEKGNSIVEKIFNEINIEIKSNIEVIFYPKNSGAAFIDFDYLTDKILLNHSIPYFEIERFQTSDGFKFPHLSSFYENISTKKKILIIDDSSNSGNSLQQLIDEIIFFDVKEIVVLVLLSRISDEKLEFLSRIKKIKGDKSEIKISILYGCHINIPTYKTDSNPNNLELNWLKQLRSIQNIPSKIYTISKKISNEIATIPIKDFDLDYKYLPWRKGKNKLSKKTLSKTRNEVGKILGHRFYNENFNYFNDILLLKKDFQNPEYTKIIEELVSVFLYEPFLYNPFKKILPDIVAILEELIEFILFSKHINHSKLLFYHWDKQDLVHLFFIIFNDKELVDKISISENFERIINFCGSNNLMALNYIFYKLLKYVPIDRTEIEIKPYSGDVKLILEKMVQANSEQFNQTILREIKYFKSFLSTLPSDKKFNSLLSKVASNYGKLTDDKEHSHAIKALYDKFRMKLIILKNKYYAELAEELFSDWENIEMFINDILKLSSTFPNFFMIHYNKIEGNEENSLINLWSYFSENIKSINSESDLSAIEKKLDWFKIFFLDKNVVPEDQLNRFYNVFSQITTPNVVKLIKSGIRSYNENLRSLNSTKKMIEYNLTKNFTEKVKLDFPHVYFKELILNEIIKNLEHRDDNCIVNIDIQITKRIVTLTIENKKKNSENRIGGNGIRLISKLNNYPNKFVTYKNNSLDELNESFIQVLTFEIT